MSRVHPTLWPVFAFTGIAFLGYMEASKARGPVTLLSWTRATLDHALAGITIFLLYGSLLFWLGRLVAYVFLGKLRSSETEAAWNTCLMFLLTRLFVIAAVAEPVQAEILTWCLWFSVMMFLKTFALLCRERFAHLSFAVSTSYYVHAKLLLLLGLVMASDVGMVAFCVSFFTDAPTSVLLLLTYECVTLGLSTLQTLIKYFVHLYDVSLEGTWEPRGTWIFYTEFVTDTLELLVTVGHYIHIWYVHGMYFNFVDVYLFVTLRSCLVKLRRRYTQYQNYRAAMRSLDQQFLDASEDQLGELNDDCAICREEMRSAKLLPCGHMFHRSCLRSWLENQQSCPTCRLPLSGDAQQAGAADAGNGNANANANDNNPDRPRRWQFVFNLANWLPNFHFEVVRGQDLTARHMAPGGVTNGGLAADRNAAYYSTQEMVRRVQEVVPDIPAEVAARDLQLTGSIEGTINRILEGELTYDPVPATPTAPEATPAAQAPEPAAAAAPAPAPAPAPAARAPASSPAPIVTSPSAAGSSSAAASPTTPSTTPEVKSYFATTPEERQNQLLARRQALLAKARQDFLAKKAKAQQEPPSPMAKAIAAPAPSTDGAGSSRAAASTTATAAGEEAVEETLLSASTNDDENTARSVVTESVAQRRLRALEAAQRRQSSGDA